MCRTVLVSGTPFVLKEGADMTIVLCDDDSNIRFLLQDLILEYFSKNKLPVPQFYSFSSGDALIEANLTADLAFLDVEMPGKSGILAGDFLMKRNPDTKVFIVTSYPDYLDEAMRFHVFRYLSKPIDKDRLFRNLGQALFQYNTEIARVVVDIPTGTQVVKVREIVYVEGVGRKTRFVLPNETLNSSHGIQYWEEKLKYPCFYPCYRGILVNMLYVFACERDKIILRYGGKSDSVYLAVRKRTSFQAALALFVESSK